MSTQPTWLKPALFAGAAAGALLLFYSVSKKRSTLKSAEKPLNLNEIEIDFMWEVPYAVDKPMLEELVKQLQAEMDAGLAAGNNSCLKMLPAYVTNPKGTEQGTFYALDLGGTNFRVLKLQLEGGRVIGASEKEQYTIPDSAMKGTSDQLFGFIADSVGAFIKRFPPASSSSRPKLGFTFSFPVNQTGVASGTLISWTKGFSTSGVEGQDVVALLNHALVQRNVEVQVVALANDTVGTQVARSYADEECAMGVILGTGTNACYLEQLSKIPKFQGKLPEGITDSMIINMEWGAFGDGRSYLPLTDADKAVDANSINPGKQLFEKMISGMYLGEIGRYTILHLIADKKLFPNVSPSKLGDAWIGRQPYKFPTANLSAILADKTSDLSGARKVVAEQLGLTAADGVSVADLKYIREVAMMVASRAARLSAAAIFAVLQKIGRVSSATVAVDGGVFEHVPLFQRYMEQTFKELQPDHGIKLLLTRDGSGVGAAVIAATVK